MAGAHLLDRVIGNDYPSFATDADIRGFEQIPYGDRIAAASTFDAITLGAAHNPNAPAIQFLPNADPSDKPVVISHRDFAARVTQAANMFHALGVNVNSRSDILMGKRSLRLLELCAAHSLVFECAIHHVGTLSTLKSEMEIRRESPPA